MSAFSISGALPFAFLMFDTHFSSALAYRGEEGGVLRKSPTASGALFLKTRSEALRKADWSGSRYLSKRGISFSSRKKPPCSSSLRSLFLISSFVSSERSGSSAGHSSKSARVSLDTGNSV